MIQVIDAGHRKGRACLAIAVVGMFVGLALAVQPASAAGPEPARWQGWQSVQYYREAYVSAFSLASGTGNRTIISWLGNGSGGGSYNVSYAGIIYSGGSWYNYYNPQITSTNSLRANNLDTAVAENRYNGYYVAFSASNGSSWDIYLGIGDPTYYSSYRLIEDGAGAAYNPHIVTDPWGNATVVWEQYDSGSYSLWSNHSTGGPYVWSGATPIEALSGNSGSCSLAIDGDGNVVAVWRQYDAGAGSVWANRLVPGIGWGSPVRLSDPADTYTYDPFLTVDSSGHATAGWFTLADSNYTLRASRYTPGGTWVARDPLLLGPSVVTGSRQAVVDPQGQVRVVWRAGSGSDYYVNTSVLPSTGAWGPTETITHSPTSVSTITAAMGAAGGVMLVEEVNTVESRQLQSFYLEPGGRWVEMEGLDSAAGPAGYIYSPQVVATADGYFHLAAINRDPSTFTYSLIAYRVRPDTQAPSLEVTSPAASVETGQPTVLVEGTAEPGARVTVNGVAAALAADGAFAVRVALEPGTNTLTVTAADAWGNEASWQGTALFNDPTPLLTAQVAQLESELSAAQQALTEAQGALAEAQANVTDAQAALDALASDQNATQADLEAAQADLATAKANVTTLQASVDSAQSDLESAQERVTALEAQQADTDSELAEASSSAADARDAAASASTMAMLGVVVGLAGVGVGALSMMRARQSGEVEVRGWDPKGKGAVESPPPGGGDEPAAAGDDPSEKG